MKITEKYFCVCGFIFISVLHIVLISNLVVFYFKADKFLLLTQAYREISKINPVKFIDYYEQVSKLNIKQDDLDKTFVSLKFKYEALYEKRLNKEKKNSTTAVEKISKEEKRNLFPVELNRILKVFAPILIYSPFSIFALLGITVSLPLMVIFYLIKNKLTVTFRDFTYVFTYYSHLTLMRYVILYFIFILILIVLLDRGSTFVSPMKELMPLYSNINTLYSNVLVLTLIFMVTIVLNFIVYLKFTLNLYRYKDQLFLSVSSFSS